MSSTAATHPTARATVAPTTSGPPLRALLIGVALAALGGAAALGDPERGEVGLLIGLTLGSALLILNGAAWALAPILIGELAIASYFVAQLGMSLRLAATLLAVIGAATIILRSSTLADPRFRRVFLPALALVAIATAGNLLFSGSEYTIKYLRYQAVQLLALLVTAAVIRGRRDLLRVGAMVLPIALLGAFVAVWQHYARGSALGSDLVSIWKGRSVGLTGSPVLLANQLAFALVPVLGLLAAGPWRRDRPRLALCAIAGLLALGLYFTYTRSALLALGPGLLAIGLCLGGGRRKLLVGGVVGAVLAFQLLAGTGLIGARYYKTAENDTSAASHESLLNVALAVALDNPLAGVGHEHFEEVSLGYLDEVPVSPGEGAIGTERPHNDFLTVWISWGVFALVVYVALFLGALRNYRIAAASDDPLIRGLAIGCVGGLATYAVNSAFHNYLDSSALLWVYAGGSVALARLVEERGARSEERPAT
jgi:O-antigen ligase